MFPYKFCSVCRSWWRIRACLFISARSHKNLHSLYKKQNELLKANRDWKSTLLIVEICLSLTSVSQNITPCKLAVAEAAVCCWLLIDLFALIWPHVGCAQVSDGESIAVENHLWGCPSEKFKSEVAPVCCRFFWAMPVLGRQHADELLLLFGDQAFFCPFWGLHANGKLPTEPLLSGQSTEPNFECVSPRNLVS